MTAMPYPHVAAALAALLATVPSAPAATTLALPNGAELVLLPGAGALEVTARLESGSLAEPGGQEGVAELTARCLTAGSEHHPGNRELIGEIGKVAGGASVTVGPGTTTLVLSHVTDLEPALALVAETLALPAFPYGNVIEERGALAAETLEALRSADARRGLAADSLRRAPRPRADAWSILALDDSAVRAFHEAQYRPERLTVVIAGTPLPAAGDLPGLAERTIARWQLPQTGSARQPFQPQIVTRSPRPLLLRGGDSGLTVAFPVPALGSAAAVMALRAAVAAMPGAPSLAVMGDAETPAGDLALPPGGVLFVHGAVADPSSATAALESSLRALSRKNLDATTLSDLVASARMPSEATGIEYLETRGRVRDAGTLVPADVRKAATALLTGPRALVAQAGDAATAAAWIQAHADSVEAPLGGPVDPIERQCEDEAREWLAAALKAHGGARLLAVTKATRTCINMQPLGKTMLPAEETRIDADLASKSWRHEVRPVAYAGATAVTYSDGRQTWVYGNEPPPDLLDGIGHVMSQARFYRLPLLALQRAADPRVSLRSEGVIQGSGAPLRRVAVADPEIGITQLDFDSDTGLLVAEHFPVYLGPPDPPIPITYRFSELASFDGVVLPERTVGETDAVPGVGSDERLCRWSFHEEPWWSPLSLLTADDDITHAAVAPSAQQAPAPHP